MQSLAVIPDIHMRRSVFQHAIELADRGHQIVFLGDYVDNGPTPNDAGFLQEIFSFARSQGAILLTGNHDLPYLYPQRAGFRQNGYEPETASEIEAVYEAYRDDIQVAHFEHRYIFSHAGFSRRFVKRLKSRYNTSSPAEVVKLVNTLEVPEVFQRSPHNGGTDLFDGPMWLRLPQYDGCWDAEGVLQVTGHSSQSTIRFRKNLLMIDVQLPLLLEW